MATFSENSSPSPSPSPSPGTYIEQLIHEAKTRWLKPAEICEILSNHDKLQISEASPNKPGSGLLFLFDRNKLRYFRKDGHNWRKKKDGKTIREAHEKLKDGNKDVIHCYYAHGEEDSNFQRRSYWLLDGGYDHIVLVHYRQVAEGNAFRSVQIQPQHTTDHTKLQRVSHNISSSPCNETCESFNSNEEASFEDTIEDNVNLRLDGFPKLHYQDQFQLPYGQQSCRNHIQEPYKPSLSPQADQCLDQTWIPDHGIVANKGETMGQIHMLVEASKNNCFEQPVTDTNERVVKKEKDLASESKEADMTGSGFFNTEEIQKLKPTLSDLMRNVQFDAADRVDPSWISRNISFGSEPYWEIDKSLPTGYESSNSGQIQMISIPDSSLLPKQLYSILDFAPNWSFAFEEAKVIVTGIFVDFIDISTTRFCCMFGEVEVPTEILRSGALRCTAPALESGTVSFYVTCNGIACSEILEFNYRIKLDHDITKSEQAKKESDQEQDLLQQIRLSKLLFTQEGEIYPEKTFDDQQEIGCRSDQWNSLCVDKSSWTQIEDMVKNKECAFEDGRSMLLQMLLKYEFQQWLCKRNVKHVSLLDSHGLGILHMVAALGYDWAIAPILETGIRVDFRDIHGWTALHWAAFCGREKVIAVLLAAGASPGSLTDPTPSDATGRIAADLAAMNGYEGIAGYLAEASLTSHLTSLKLDAVNGHEAVEVVSEKSIVHASSGMSEDELSLKDSLAAVRNAAQAATRIQSAFRAYSFSKRHVKDLCLNEFGISDETARAIALAQASHAMLGNHHEKLNLAATQIQCKYRAWKGRKDFISLRKHVVKIQAHVRGHQFRIKYKKLLSVVGIMEKAILRWRRKGTGLRGYKTEAIAKYDSDDETFLKDFRKQKEEAFVDAFRRVKEMVENPKARTQYRRMLEIYNDRREKGRHFIDNDIIFDAELMSLFADNEFSMTCSSSL